MRVACDDVGAVVDCPDVAKVNRRTGCRTDWGVEKLGKIPAKRGVGSRNAIDFIGAQITRRLNDGSLVHGGDSFFGRDTVLLKLIGIERNDDRPLCSAKWWGRRNAFQRCK